MSEGPSVAIGVKLTEAAQIAFIEVSDLKRGTEPVVRLTLTNVKGELVPGKEELAAKAARRLFRLVQGRRLLISDLREDAPDPGAA